MTIYNHISYLFCTGNLSKKYFISEGVAADKIKIGYYTSDYKKMAEEYNSVHISRNRLRQQNNIKDTDRVFLFVGKLISSRDIGRLVNVFKRLRDENENIVLLIIGDGPDESLVNEISDNKLIHIKSVPYGKLSEYYVLADYYIHPGWEPYSLAIVQAVVYKLPIIASDEIGAVYEYVRDQENGIIVRAKSEDSLYTAIKVAMITKFEDSAMDAAQNIVVEKGIQWAAKQLCSAIEGCDKENALISNNSSLQ